MNTGIPARARLIAFPHAGGGAGNLRLWRAALPAWISLELVQLPGRESRFAETPMCQLTDITRAVSDAVMRRDDAPFALFGHSMGSILAFEVAREIRSRGGRPPSALIVSGRCAPQLASRTPRLASLDSGELVRRVADLYGGIPAAALADPELIEMMARVLKPDLHIVETYSYREEPPFDYPLAAFGGASDPSVSANELEAWREQTSASFTSEVFEGDHFYFRSRHGEKALLAKLRLICATVSGIS